MTTMNLSELRKQLRKQRRQLSRFTQKQTQQRILNMIRTLPEFHASKSVGVYLDAFGEVRTQALIEYCFKHHKRVYLPNICNMNQQLTWVEISQNQYRSQRFAHHRLGMREPMATRGLHVSKLDLLVMPLLACDQYGTRIGMGGGYYDRTLATPPHRPFRLGLAHDFQLIPQPLTREVWDQPLDALLTPTLLQRFKR